MNYVPTLTRGVVARLVDVLASVGCGLWLSAADIEALAVFDPSSLTAAKEPLVRLAIRPVTLRALPASKMQSAGGKARTGRAVLHTPRVTLAPLAMTMGASASVGIFERSRKRCGTDPGQGLWSERTGPKCWQHHTLFRRRPCFYVSALTTPSQSCATIRPAAI